MELKDIMTTDVITVTGEDTITSAAQKMREANVGCLVVANDGTVEGIITDRDMTVNCSSEGHNPQQCNVSQHMTSPVITTEPDTDILDSVRIMTEEQVKRLPVAEDGRLVGLVSFSDIAEALDQPMHDLLIGMGAVRRPA